MKKASNRHIVTRKRQIEEAETNEKAVKEILAKHDLRAETKGMRSAAVPVTNFFGGEEYVKVKKSKWNKILDVFNKAVSRNHLLEKYEKKIFGLERKIDTLTEQVEKLKRFAASRGLGEAFVEFVKFLALKTMKQRLDDAKSEADVHNRQKEMPEKGQAEKCKRWQQEM